MYLNYITYKSYFVNKIDKNDSISNLIRYGTNSSLSGVRLDIECCQIRI